ncbi:BZ3500_MvSof-1268-A1-R1_Chr8-1g09818 [Microbotryum saponariae]|uniref:BZ3500_MvSof-1268-A1-R1_Chr8-1g09818 protein n=1 Tax=Microbotryum saponariae TaxID=289078 RepID=A0A2X0KU10_9BASI|nr:BZ3500_MvSof-1268-A1-R1_Chr8-1g09818 [Microbotryum saponariae]SDA08104.1 BZ3501_MvSof-1269-A2-R1_Chr8-1g09541 [Microbotryum saponariae]
MEGFADNGLAYHDVLPPGPHRAAPSSDGGGSALAPQPSAAPPSAQTGAAHVTSNGARPLTGLGLGQGESHAEAEDAGRTPRGDGASRAAVASIAHYDSSTARASSMDRSAASSSTSNSNSTSTDGDGGSSSVASAHLPPSSDHHSGVPMAQERVRSRLVASTSSSSMLLHHNGDMEVDDDASSSAPPTPLLAGQTETASGDATGDDAVVSSSGTATPVLNPTRELEEQEIALFGAASVEDSLPPPPREIAGKGKVGGWGSNGASAGLALGDGIIKPGSKRAQKSIKISAGSATSVKGPKILARRAAVSAHKAFSGEEAQLPNNDYCDACLGKGHFLCCDGGCLRSFHFTCLDPPLDVDQVPDEAWYCKACRAAKRRCGPSRATHTKESRDGDVWKESSTRFFRELIHKIDCENPKVFSLGPDIKSLYKNIATGAVGEYIDTTEHRPPSKITGRAVGQEERDGYKLRDKTGKTLICYHCNETASIAKQRRIISCDFCDQHWHLDCLDPPLVGMPPPTRKWMCPAHTQHVLPKKRIPRSTTTIPVQPRDSTNNGDILVIPKREPRLLDDDRYEEITVNRVRYQVPEETIILDFWGKAGALQASLKASLALKALDKSSAELATNRQSSPDMDVSSDESEDDALDRRHPSHGPRSSSGLSALDGLALLAEIRFADLQASKEEDVTMGEGVQNWVGSTKEKINGSGGDITHTIAVSETN